MTTPVDTDPYEMPQEPAGAAEFNPIDSPVPTVEERLAALEAVVFHGAATQTVVMQ